LSLQSWQVRLCSRDGGGLFLQVLESLVWSKHVVALVLVCQDALDAEGYLALLAKRLYFFLVLLAWE
jgi:hypothetical protein